MKAFHLTLTWLTAALLAGCGHKDGDGHGHEPATGEGHDAIEVPSFNEKDGLFLPEITRRSLDLKLVEITEQEVETTISLSLRVHESNVDQVLATAMLSPDQSLLLKPGQPMEAKLADGTPCAGTIRDIRTGMRHATGSDELIAAFSRTPSGLAVGDFMSATVRVPSSARVATIPRQALLENSEGQFVYTVSGEHFVRTAIKTGARNAERVEVTDGLYAGDEVVLRPVLSLWLTELAALKGGQACCVTPPKGK